MNRKWKKYIGGAVAILLGFGAADRCFGFGETGAERPETAVEVSQVSGWEDLGDDTEALEGSLRDKINEAEGSLSAAIQAMKTLKVRVFDSHHHAVQIEYLKLIQETSLKTSDHRTEQNRAEAALIILKRLCNDLSRKPLFIKALASTMGGAKWISKRAFNDPASLSVNAIRVLLILSRKESSLNHGDRMGILQQLRHNKVLANTQSLFWAAVRSLTIQERIQLGDCFGTQPRSNYEDRREYFRLQRESRKLRKQITLSREKNGPPGDQEGHIARWEATKRELENQIVALREKRPSAYPFYYEQEPVYCRKPADFLKHYKRLEVFPPEEAALRRDILAGKPNASIADCWNAVIFKEDRFRPLGTHEAFTNELKEYREKYVALKLWFDSTPSTLHKFLPHALQVATRCEEYSQLFPKIILVDSLVEETYHQLGTQPRAACYDPKDDYQIWVVLEIMQNLIQRIDGYLHPEQKLPDGIFRRQRAQKHLDVPPDMDPTQRRQIEEILRIAARMETESLEIL
jgi:hypothetical protein